MVDETPESPAEPEEQASAPSDVDPLAEHTGIEAARACIGSKLDELGGATVGRVEAVLADALDGTPTWLVVRLSRFGKRAAVPFDFVAPGVGHVWAPYPRDTIRGANEPDPTGGLSCGDERALGTRFGLPETGGRLAALAGRDDDERGSVPA